MSQSGEAIKLACAATYGSSPKTSPKSIVDEATLAGATRNGHGNGRVSSPSRNFGERKLSSQPCMVDEDDYDDEEVREEYVALAHDFDYFITEINKLVQDYYEECGRPKSTNISSEGIVSPDQVIKALGPVLNRGSTNEEVMRSIETTFKYSMKTMHPFFLDKLYCGGDPVSQVAELVVAVLNTNVHVYHVSPVFSVMEMECVRMFGEQLGMDPDKIDGTMNAGGTMSNTTAFMAARHEHFPHVKEKGWQPNDRPVAFTAAESHYSINRAAATCGMGSDRLIKVPCLRKTGQMDPVALEKLVKEEVEKGNHPFFVNSTAGTTVMGSFDDFNAISDICEKYGMWNHVDACWGGFLMFASPEKRGSVLDGIERVDSIATNPHKGLGVPTQCCLLITNGKKGHLRRTCNSGAEYLFLNENREGDELVAEEAFSQYDIGDKTLACGRRADAVKLWLSMKKHGLGGYRNIVDGALDKAARLEKLLRASPERFQMVSEPMGPNVCFYYVPRYFRSGGREAEFTDDVKAAVHKLVFKRMRRNGRVLIQQQPMKEFGLPNFFRLVFGAHNTRLEDIEFLLEEIERLGGDITPKDL